MKKILIDTNSINGRRSALIDGDKLIDFDLEFEGNNFQKGSIHKGKITKIEGSLEAIFVELGSSRHGFLPFKELSPEYFDPSKTGMDRFKIKEGENIVVQIEKEERVNKGAALSTYVSLASRYIVLMTNHPTGGGISRRIHGEERDKIKNLLDALDIPENMSVIIRTAGIDKQIEELKWDLEYLKKLWVEVSTAIKGSKSSQLIYADQSLIQKTIRDYFKEEIGELVVDNEEDYKSAKTYANKIVPDFIEKIKLYDDEVPLFASYGIESKIESAFSREVKLKSGASLVIDSGEALTSIDINSAKSTKGGDIEETARNTNLEAAISLSTQLKLRDIGGLIVVDFIDMMSINSQKDVMRKMAELSKIDKAKIQFSRISKFGLMEISRQKLKSSIIDVNNETCPTCGGSGQIKSLTTLSVSFLRILEEEAMKSDKPLTVYLPVRLATYLLNEKRDLIQGIEERHSVAIKVVPDPDTEGSNYNIDREGLSAEEFKASLKNNKANAKDDKKNMSPTIEAASVGAITPKSLPPKPTPMSARKVTPRRKPGIFKRLILSIKSLLGIKTKKPYRPRSYNRKRFNNKNSSYKFNKYKSFNNRRRRNYNNKNSSNNSSQKSNTTNAQNSNVNNNVKSNTSD